MFDEIEEDAAKEIQVSDFKQEDDEEMKEEVIEEDDV